MENFSLFPKKFARYSPPAVTIYVAMDNSTPREEKIGSKDVTVIDWPAVLHKHRRWLRTVIGVRLRDSEAVDEVMQEVSLAAVRQSAPVIDQEKLAPWLYRVAIRQTLLYRRAQGRQKKLTDRFIEQTNPREEDHKSSDPLTWLLADERQRLVRQALETLPRRDREILLLKYTQDWSYRQMAEHLGISHSAVEARLFRARRRLRACLATYDVVEIDT